MGILGEAGTLPVIVLALLAGTVVDRRSRPILIATNVGRALCLLVLPLAALLGVLQIEWLYGVAFAAGALGVLFDVAYVAYLPSLVSPAELVEGNGKLQLSQASAQAAEPGMASALVQLIGAPLAIAADALSFLVAAVTLIFIPAREPVPLQQQKMRSILYDLVEGLKTLRAVPVLWNLLIWGACFNLCSVIIDTVYVFYVTRQLNIAVDLLGVILAITGIGGIAGAMLGNHITNRVGAGRAIFGLACVVCLSRLLLPLASGSDSASVALFIFTGATGRFAIAVLAINLVSIQQVVSPQAMLGRITGVTRVVISGLLPLSALLGGGLGERIGVRTMILVGGLGAMLSLLLFWRSPLLTLSLQPVDPTIPRRVR